MTITPIRTRDRSTRRAIAQDMVAPLNEVPLDVQVAQLQAVLADASLSGWHDDARTALANLTAAATLAA